MLTAWWLSPTAGTRREHGAERQSVRLADKQCRVLARGAIDFDELRTDVLRLFERETARSSRVVNRIIDAISTSYVERHNRMMRMRNRRLTRRSTTSAKRCGVTITT
jgi:hypothetical protein